LIGTSGSRGHGRANFHLIKRNIRSINVGRAEENSFKKFWSLNYEKCHNS